MCPSGRFHSMTFLDSLQRKAIENFLVNPNYPRQIRRTALRAFLGSYIGRRWRVRAPKVEIRVERSWRAGPGNEPSPKRIAAWRRKYPKPFTFYKEDLFDRVFHYLNQEVEFVDGRWGDSFPDSALYGIVADTLAYRMTHDPSALERAKLSKRANRADIRAARKSPRQMIEHGEKSLMSALGILLAYSDLPDWELVPEAVSLINDFTELMQLLGGYIDTDLPVAFADYYGLSTPSAFFFLMNLFLADFYRRHDHPVPQGKAIGTALRLLDNIRERVFDPDGPRYRFAPDEDRPYCYPNPLMILGLTMLHGLTKDPAALTEAEGIFGWLQNLKDEERGGYWTPYINRLRGQRYNLNIKSLSAQNYILFACLYLYRYTKNRWYLREMKSLLDFIERDLYYDGLIWHDIENRKRAGINSLEPYCVGCNLMTLYLLMEINFTDRLGPKLVSLDTREKENEKVTSVVRG
jgi:hypothetical protein